MAKHTKKRMAVYLDPDIKDWWEEQADAFGCAASTLASQLLTVASRRCISPADALAAVAAHNSTQQHVSARSSTQKHDMAHGLIQHVSARSDPRGGHDGPPQPFTGTLPPPPPEVVDAGEENPDVAAALGLAFEHREHDPKNCPYADDPWSQDGTWFSVFTAKSVTERVIQQARVALEKAAACTHGVVVPKGPDPVIGKRRADLRALEERLEDEGSLPPKWQSQLDQLREDLPNG